MSAVLQATSCNSSHAVNNMPIPGLPNNMDKNAKIFLEKTSYEQNSVKSFYSLGQVTFFVADSEKTVHGLKCYIKQSGLI